VPALGVGVGDHMAHVDGSAAPSGCRVSIRALGFRFGGECSVAVRLWVFPSLTHLL